MTEEEAKAELFKIHFEYMMNPPEVRLKKYNEYKEKRGIVKYKLTQAIREKRENQVKIK